MLSFAEAVTTCVVRKPLTFRGRAPRSEFWWFMLATLIGYVIVSIIAVLCVMIQAIGSTVYLIILSAYLIAVAVLMLSASVRRLHDTNHSGWWIASPCGAAILGVLVLAAIANSDDYITIGIIGIFFRGLEAILGLVVFIFYLLPGTKGPNRFGPDPLAPAAASAHPQPSVLLPGADSDFTKLGK